MDRDEFTEKLIEDGFQPPVVVLRESNGFLDVHVHPFEAKALVLRGELTIKIGGDARVYCAGQVFHLPANEPHSESYGSDGVEYLVGRK